MSEHGEGRRLRVFMGIAVACAVGASACGSAAHARDGVATKAPGEMVASKSVSAEWPSMPGKELLGDRTGSPVGYVDTERVNLRGQDAHSQVNARTLVPVNDANGNLVGDFAFSLGFIPLNVVTEPGFDVEDYRASEYGGCEPVIGAGLNQKYPLCPPLGGTDAP